MSDTYRTKWRCPYCDAENDWQNAICQVCGDGVRPDADSGPTTSDKNSSSRETVSSGRSGEYRGLKEEPRKAPSGPAGTRVSTKPEKRKKSGVGQSILVAVLAFVFISAVASMITNGSGSITFKSPARGTTSPVPTTIYPPVTYSPTYTTTEPYQYTFTTPTPTPTRKPKPALPSESTVYSYMHNLWFGKRYDGMKVNFFTDSDGSMGGIYYYWSSDTSDDFKYGFIVGSLSGYGDRVTISDDFCRFSRHVGEHMKLWGTAGEHTVTVKLGSNGSVHISGTIEEESFDMDLYTQNADYRSSLAKRVNDLIHWP